MSSHKSEINRVLAARFGSFWRHHHWIRPSIDGEPKPTSPITSDHRSVPFTAYSVARTADRPKNSAMALVCAARPEVET